MATGQWPNVGRFTRNRSLGNGSTRKRRIGTLTTTTPGAEQYGSQSQHANLLAIDYFFGATASGVTGAAATTEEADTSTASGSPIIVGTSAQTETADTSTATGSPIIVGTSATTEAADTSTASGGPVVPVEGTAAITEADDTSTASGTPIIVGTSAQTEANDTSTASGSPIIVGTSATTNVDDTSTATGTPIIVGTSATTNVDDISTAEGGPVSSTVTGTAAITEPDDTSTATGDSGTPTPDDGGSHSYGRPKPRRFDPPRRLPLILPTITGAGHCYETDDLPLGFGAIDPFDLLRDELDLLELV